MGEKYTVIELKGWKRAMHCQVFRTAAQPRYCISFPLDITGFVPKIKERGYSFTMAFVYAVSKCANEIEEFRYRFLEGDVVLYDRIDTSFTYLDQETELFKVVNVRMQDSMEEYVKIAKETLELQKEYFTGPLGNDIFQFSGLPWLPFTHTSHTDSGKRDQATPLFDWGKYERKDNKILLPFSVEVHHSFVDGIHIGKLKTRLEEYLNGSEL